MRVEPRPTRAEVSEAANAVEEGADAIMLAGETAAGAYPLQAVQMLDAVIRDAEKMLPEANVPPPIKSASTRHGQALAQAAVTLATTGQAAAIVAVTTEGRTAKLLSAYRPLAPILAAAPSRDVAASLSLWWGVCPFVAAERDFDRLAIEIVERRLLAAGELAVFVNVSPEQDRPDANFLHVRRVSARGAS